MEKWLVLAALVTPGLCLPTFGSFFGNSAPPAPPPPPPPPSPPAQFFNPPPPPPTKFTPPTFDCVYGEWTQWSTCTAACGATAFISRTRIVLKEGSGYGAKCDPSQLEQWQECQGEPCAQNCQMGDWTQWTVCSANCGEGQRNRNRQVITPAANGGFPCGPTEESEPCNSGPCPVNCQMSPWSLWSQCSSQCGEGQRQRLRSVQIPAAFGGLPCGPVEEWEACNNGPCAKDCVLGDWAPWTQCPSCGQASRSRSRSIVEQGAFGGVVCDFTDLSETESCNISPCPVHCEMEQWSAWSRCSSDCGSGRRARTRSIKTPAAYGGQPCGPAEEWEACSNGPCAVDCKMSEWGQWSQCSAPCNGGQRQRLRSIQTQAQFGGLACGPTEELEACNSNPCPQDCVLGEWAPWTPCPACGQANRNRQRSIVTQGAYGGAQCDFTDLSETESCNLRPCAIDCVMEPWSAWSQCSSQCGEGQRQRLRSVKIPAQFGGRQCGPAEEWEACNNGPCAKDCVLGDWAPWTQCPSCGQASRSRSRSIVEQGAFGGVVCDFTDLSETESCNLPSCAVDCVVSQWSPWSSCSAECGSGNRQRLRSVLTQASNGGKPCPSLEEWAECTNGPCRQPSICDNIQGTQYFADGCTPNFILCQNGQEFPKVCPEPSRFDVAATICKLPAQVPACASSLPPAPVPSRVFNPPAPVRPAPPAPPAPAPPAPAPQAPAPPAPPAPQSFFSRAASFFSYDTPSEPTLPPVNGTKPASN